MTRFVIGDLHGCIKPLQRLLVRLGADTRRDRFHFLGDLVNRGPDSLATLRFVRDLGDRATVVLGNHDLHLLAVLNGIREPSKKDTLDEILRAPDRDELADWLPNQSHHFNGADSRKRMIPAGPDHAQVAAAGAVLDYVEATTPGFAGDLRGACAAAKETWQTHEASLLQPVLRWLDDRAGIRVIGPTEATAGMHRCPIVGFVSEEKSSAEIAAGLIRLGVMANNGNFYAQRVLEGTGVDIDDGVVRVSWVHYTSQADIDHLLGAIEQVLAATA